MAHKRKNFTDKQKAIIFVRDRATCCFSGANLWLLDSPLRPDYQVDWVDHVLPSARGGSSDIGNGVCASHTYNAKKRDNTADNFYIFEKGLPTSEYFNIFGLLSQKQEARLQRLFRLNVEDWFFNRAITWVMAGFDDRCHREFYDSDYVRDADYFFSAAYSKLQEYQKKSASSDSLENRGIVNQPNSVAQQWLKLRNVDSKNAFLTIVEDLFPSFRCNYIAWAEFFWDSETADDVSAAYEAAYERITNSEGVALDVRESIECAYRLMQTRENKALHPNPPCI